MRIDSYMQVSQIYNTNKTRRSPYASQADTKDSLEISDFGSAYHIAKQAAAAGSDVREDKVADIKSRLEAGTYNVTLSAVAEKLADRLLA